MRYIGIGSNYYQHALTGAFIYIGFIISVLMLIGDDISIISAVSMGFILFILTEIPRILIFGYFDIDQIHFDHIAWVKKHMNMILIGIYIVLALLNIPGIGYSVVGIFSVIIVLWCIIIMEALVIFQSLKPLKKLKSSILIHASASVIIVLYMIVEDYISIL